MMEKEFVVFFCTLIVCKKAFQMKRSDFVISKPFLVEMVFHYFLTSCSPMSLVKVRKYFRIINNNLSSEISHTIVNTYSFQLSFSNQQYYLWAMALIRNTRSAHLWFVDMVLKPSFSHFHLLFFLIHSADPQSRPVVVRTSVPTFQNLPIWSHMTLVLLIYEADQQSRRLVIIVLPHVRSSPLKKKQFEAKTMFTTGKTVGLAEWIIFISFSFLFFLLTDLISVDGSFRVLSDDFNPELLSPDSNAYRNKAREYSQKVLKETILDEHVH